MGDTNAPRFGDHQFEETMKRRNVLKLTGVVTATVVGGVGTASARSDELAHQLERARAATREYRDVQLARDDGYGHVSPYVPGMGFHFQRGVPPRGTDVHDPPILVYFPDGSYDPDPFDLHDSDRDDDLVLGAVEYAVDSDGPGDDPAPDLFADEDSSRNVKVSEDAGWHWTPPVGGHALHTWVHRGNPAGVFHPTNPTV